MSDDSGFRARPRSSENARDDHDRANALTELRSIRERLHRVAATSPDDFLDTTPAYDAASMAVIRLHAVLERPENAWLAERLTPFETRAVSTLRSIVAHAGYRSMDDRLFWRTVTGELPDLVDRLLAG